MKKSRSLLSDAGARAAMMFLTDCESYLGDSLATELLLGNDSAVFSCFVNPNGYTDWKAFAIDYQVVSLFRKHPLLNLNINKMQVAVDGFFRSESICSSVNQKFRRLNAETTGRNAQYWAYLQRARMACYDILGDFSWDSAIGYSSFGPGSNIGIPRRLGHKWYKFGQERPTVTGNCLPLLETLIAWEPLIARLGLSPKVVKGSKLSTVPKDARKDRCIATEPLWNMFFQKGIGGLLRSRLKLWGIDLDTQETNQRLALQGSVDDLLCTIDLSSASDCISRELVRFLLPDSWYNAMELCRSHSCELPDGSSLVLEKISSMGNGFTFELESLIFFVLCKAVAPKCRSGCDLAIYGDDIIIPSKYSEPLIDLLSFVGFSTNKEKSFISGPFRESCGKHYFRGHDVTPLYVSKGVNSTDALLVLINNIRRAAHRLGGNLFCDKRWVRAYLSLIDMLPSRIRQLSIPDNVGDNAVVRDFDEVSPKPIRHNGQVEGFIVKTFCRLPHTLRGDGIPALLVKLFDPSGKRSLCGDTYCRDLDIPTERVRWRVISSLVTQWTTLGPWL